MLIVCRPKLAEEDFQRLAEKLRIVPFGLRWARRGGRLVIHLDHARRGETTWALRVNPSSGNLHPTEGYVVCGPDAASGRSGVFHYAPDAHALEERCAFDAASWTAARTGLPEGSFLAALTSIHWREAWKYGERAFRYCQHDIGHAVADMRMAAATMGWTCTIVPGWHRARSPHCSAWTGTWTSRVPSPRSRRA